MLVTTIPGALRHPLSRASPFQAYSLYPALGLLGRVVLKKGVVVVRVWIISVVMWGLVSLGHWC